MLHLDTTASAGVIVAVMTVDKRPDDQQQPTTAVRLPQDHRDPDDEDEDEDDD